MVIFSSNPFGFLANIQRPRANIHVRYDIYHIPLRQSLDVISHPFPFIIGYYDEEFGMRRSTPISVYDVK